MFFNIRSFKFIYIEEHVNRLNRYCFKKKIVRIIVSGLVKHQMIICEGRAFVIRHLSSAAFVVAGQKTLGSKVVRQEPPTKYSVISNCLLENFAFTPRL